ncbi:MAG: AsmA-like C-terminal region-containing protein [Bacteroidia bacterium]|nr:AsmA-like C-terminal region-containing protein [Bacteroidia bacterium]MCX7652989.1 AsmA-like C-terminal region-containing protein [Bacteroidia bacterium]MDW8417185.1 AsmA-like C-terminal region-containing protein [Bacteroidia bacterium]
MKRLLRLFLGLIIGFFMALGGLVLLIYFSRDKLIAWVLSEVERSFAAQIHIEAIKVGTLRALPDLGIQLGGFIMRTQRGDTLFTADEILLHLNLWEALVQKKYRIRALTIQTPRFWLIYDKKGHTPWEDISTASEKDSTEPSPWALEKVVVEHGSFIYRDKQANFSLYLLIADLNARIRSDSGVLQIAGQVDGTIRHLSHHKKVWFESRTFGLAGEITYEKPWLIFSRLELSVAGLLSRLNGGIKLAPEHPELSLRVEDIQLDLAEMKTWWPEAPEELAQLNGSLKGQGDVLGPAGKGKLPRLRLSATLHVGSRFFVGSYPCHAIYAKGQVEWNAESPKQSYLQVDTLFFAGGERDTIYLKGRYILHSEKVSAKFYAHFNLANLWQWKIPRTDSLKGEIQVLGTVSLEKNRWHLSGKGSLHQVVFSPVAVEKLEFEVSPSRLNLSDVSLWYEGMHIRSPALEVGSYERFWDTSAAPLSVRGKVFIPTFAYLPTPDSSTGGIPWVSDLFVQIDTFRWGKVICGPIRGRFIKENDTFRVINAEVNSIATGRITVTGIFSPVRIQGQGSFQGIDLVELYRQVPELDTLFPLLKHIRGTVSGSIQTDLPFRQKRLSWAEAEGDLVASLRNIVVLESPYTYELFSLIPLTDFKRIEVGHVDTRLTLREGILRTDTTWLHANRWKMRIAGAHSLRGELAYDLLVEVPRVILDKSALRVAEFVEESEGEMMKLYITVSGTVEAPKFSWKAGLPSPKPLQPAPMEKKKKKRSKREALPVQEE